MVPRSFAPAFLLANLVLLLAACDVPARRPLSFLVVVVDDLGWADVRANAPGSFYTTPHLDRLAAAGVRFSNGYAASPVCSPTRYSLMTGRDPARVAATNYFSGQRAGRFQPATFQDYLAPAEETLAETLRAAGYRTGFLGKWHLGPGPEHWPEAQGFEDNRGGHRAGMPASYFAPYRNPRLADGPPGEYLTERLTDEALALLAGYGDQRFFLYLAYYTVHVPLQAPADEIARQRGRVPAHPGELFAEEEQVWPGAPPRRVRQVQSHATYAAMIAALDAQVGRLLAGLEACGRADDTVVVFVSDNGGLSSAEGAPTSNLPLRGGKGWLYEGGLRVPFFVRLPGGVRGVDATPVHTNDLAPTLIELAGLAPRPDLHTDGRSLVPLLTGAPLPERTLHWHYPHYSNQGGFPGSALRRGRYKLIERHEDGRRQLYDMELDPGELHDLAAQEPERAAALGRELWAWYDGVGARFLRPMPGGPAPWSPR